MTAMAAAAVATLANPMVRIALLIGGAFYAYEFVQESGETAQKTGDAAVKIASSMLVVGAAYVAYKEFVD